MNGNRVLAADGSGLAAAAAALRAGGVMGFPTDTVYGMAASVEIPEAVRAISLLKGRPVSQPLILMVAEIGEVDRYALLSPFAGRIAARHWPGALTLILPALEPAFVLGGGPTVGVRIPAHPIALALLRQGGPLATTSANRHGCAPALGAKEALEQLPGLAGAISEAPEDRVAREPSSILDLSKEPPRLLRAGRLDWSALGLVDGDGTERRQ
jgi:L-threonylcarbamoyladenylate synthase